MHCVDFLIAFQSWSSGLPSICLKKSHLCSNEQIAKREWSVIAHASAAAGRQGSLKVCSFFKDNIPCHSVEHGESCVHFNLPGDTKERYGFNIPEQPVQVDLALQLHFPPSQQWLIFRHLLCYLHQTVCFIGYLCINMSGSRPAWISGASSKKSKMNIW